MRIATIDIGTNSVLLLVVDAFNAGGQNRFDIVCERATVTRLGQGVDKAGRLAPEAIERTRRTLSAYAETIDALGATTRVVVGTSAMRDGGAGSLVDFIRDRLGADVRVLSGDEEARAMFEGALTGIDTSAWPDRVAVFDLGGGSTEFACAKREDASLPYALEWSQSFDIGSVRQTERHDAGAPTSARALDAITRDAREAFTPADEWLRGRRIVGVAGTVTTLKAVELGLDPYDAKRVHGARLTRAALTKTLERLAALDLDARKAVPGLSPGRADVIVAGAAIVLAALDAAGADELVVSDRGVRWGLAVAAAGAPATLS